MFNDILQRFLNFGAFFSLYSVEIATKYTKFCHAGMCGNICLNILSEYLNVLYVFYKQKIISGIV